MARSRDRWPTPSEPVAGLIRAFATETLRDSEELFREVDDAVFAAAPEQILAEPAFADAFRTANHANLGHWMAANVTKPGRRVPANVGPETLDLARDIVRRGFDDTSLNSYRVGQNAALRYVIRMAFAATDDLDVLRELLDVVTRSVFAFVDDTLAAIEREISNERDQLSRGTHAERLATVNLILEGAPIAAELASARLGYELAGRHRAAVVWAADSAEAGAMERAAAALARASGASRAFTVVASARSLWVWVALGSGAPGPPAEAELTPGIRAAIGSDGEGVAGFRRSHFDALATQRLMQRAHGEVRLASYADVELVALAAADEALAGSFAERRLGGLAEADPVLRETLLAWIRADLNASAAARELFAHRNTVLNRIERARELLPAPIEGHVLELGLALEIDRWLGLAAR
ncbi:MAG: PucR family transcriptional regulator [Solirubrobacterales bacterium]|nr:PucR family transcriptional regulator [Solirubrobacterales bacterium]